jgi:Zn-dependent protease
MSLIRGGSLWLFRLTGIDVYVHWSWLLVALFQVQNRTQIAQEGSVLLPLYNSNRWYWIEYLSLFAIVLMHEFGHALACRQVGGQADEIILWPLGGIAFVKPPPRPSAILWTASAGPLVNVLLLPILGACWFLESRVAWGAVNADLPLFLHALFWINFGILLFNLLPVYPMDGGQILHAVLWFAIGRAESLMVVSLIGMMVGGGVLMLALLNAQLWWCILAGFVLFTASAGYRYSRVLARVLSGPRRLDAVCPSCKTSPLLGNYWTCNECGTRFDIFHNRGQCPGCGQLYRTTKCPECYRENPIAAWFAPADKEPQ